MIADRAPQFEKRDADLPPAALRLLARSLLKPRFKLCDGIGVQRRAVERAAPVILAEIA